MLHKSIAKPTDSHQLVTVHSVAHSGDTKQMKSMLDNGIASLVNTQGTHTTDQALTANPDHLVAVDGDGNTPLHFAAGANNIEMVRLLLSRDANVTIKVCNVLTMLSCN